MGESDFFRRRLPHWHPSNATFFVTFRLAGSLPYRVSEQLRREQEAEEQRLARRYQAEALAKERYELSKKMFARYDAYLDRGTGPCWLAERRVAEMVQREIHNLHPQIYHLIAYCIMPNHVHLLIDLQDIPDPQPLRPGQHYTPLSHAMRLLKGRTGYLGCQMVGGSGAFWQHESYDHVVRDERELMRIVKYILDNPVRAGLAANWQEYPFLFVDEVCRANL
jgi:REP element-mobilizing transposase RayT